MLKLEDEFLFEVVAQADSNRQSLKSYFDRITELFYSSSLGGRNRLKQYVQNVSSLIYLPDNIIFEVVSEDGGDASILEKKLRNWFYEEGMDLFFFDVIKEALIYGSCFLKLLPNPPTRFILLNGVDVQFYYPSLPLDHPDQIITVYHRMPLRTFQRKYQSLLEELEIKAGANTESTVSPVPRFILERIVPDVKEDTVSFQEKLPFYLTPPTLQGGEMVEIKEVYYLPSSDSDVYNMAVFYEDHLLYHGASPYVRPLMPVLGFIIDPREDFPYGTSAIAEVSNLIDKIKRVYAELEEVIEMLKYPPLIISSSMLAIEEEKIRENMRPKGVITLESVDTRVDQYVSKADIQAFLTQIQLYEKYLEDILLVNETVLGAMPPKNIRSASHYTQFLSIALSQVRFLALAFEQFFETVMTQALMHMIYHSEELSMQFAGDKLRVEVYAHSTSPINTFQYLDLVLSLADAGIFPTEELIDILPIPYKDKIKKAFQQKAMQEMMNQNQQKD